MINRHPHTVSTRCLASNSKPPAIKPAFHAVIPGWKSPPLHEALIEYHDKGICVVVVKPATRRIYTPTAALTRFGKFAKKRPTLGHIYSWLMDPKSCDSPDLGLAVTTGKLSGGLKAVVFYNMREVPQGGLWQNFIRLIPRKLAAKLAVERCPIGMQLLYRSGKAADSCPLAVSEDAPLFSNLKFIGDGHRVLVAPSAGYQSVSGSLATVARLTEHEENLLFGALKQAALESGCVWLPSNPSAITPLM